MTRLFDEHKIRKTVSLSGVWEMMPDTENIGYSQNWKNGLPAGARKVTVPSVWNTELDLFGYTGVCWYQKRFRAEDTNALLEFEGVSGRAEVYLDGRKLAAHKGGFTAFYAPCVLDAGTHLLVVSVDNGYYDDSIPHAKADWYNYGGIIRNVTLHCVPDAYILRSNYEYELDETLTKASVKAQAAVIAQCDKSVQAVITLDGNVVSEFTLELKQGENLITSPEFVINDIEVWQPGAPKLYKICLTVGKDDLIDRIGFRKIEIRNREILLNGKPLFFKGVNRHEEHPDWGHAVPPQINARDVQIIRDLGANIIRGSHYPNSKQFMDMLDENGIMFWSEIPMWQFSKAAMADDGVIKNGLNMHREMAEQYYNHPSIIIWGLNNECETTSQEAHALNLEFYKLLKRLGGNRLITYATMLFENDVSLDACDFVSVNKYHGWYESGLDAWEAYIPSLVKRLDELGMAEKPVVMSEFGAAAIYGYTSFDGNKWSEEYEAETLTKVIKVCKKTPGVAGAFVWQYADIRSQSNLLRARGFNNKGLVNEFRRPKLAYYAVKAEFAEKE